MNLHIDFDGDGQRTVRLAAADIRTLQRAWSIVSELERQEIPLPDPSTLITGLCELLAMPLCQQKGAKT